MWHFQMGLLVHTTHDTLALFLFDYAVKSYGNMVRHHLVLWIICCGLTGLTYWSGATGAMPFVARLICPSHSNEPGHE